MARFLALTMSLFVLRAQAQAITELPEVMHLPASTLEPGLSEREAALGAQLHVAAESDRHRHWLDWGMLAVGTAMGTVGAIYLHEVGPLLLPIATRAVTTGTVNLAVSEDAEPIRAQYASMPMFGAEQARARIEFGEHALSRRARQHRTLRLVSAAMFLFSAACYVPLRYGLARSRDPDYRFGDSLNDYLLLSLAGLDAGFGTVLLFERSQPEQALRAYRDMVAGHEERGHVSFRLTPRGMTLRF
jgi:hypothetical protein